MESLKGKVISNSSLTLSNFLCAAINLEIKLNHFFLETKMTKRVLQLYIYTATFYSFHMLFICFHMLCSKSAESFESFRRSMWVKKLNPQITFMSVHVSHNPPKCTVDTVDLRKTLDFFYIYFFGQ